MAPPPAEPENRETFEKLSGRKSPRVIAAQRERGADKFDQPELRRLDIVLIGVVVLTLLIGGWLIFSGLI